MMERMMVFLVMLGVGVLVVFMVVKEEERFDVRYKPTSYSRIASSRNEEIKIQFFASEEESFYLDQSYVSNAKIRHLQTSEEVAITIEEIVVSDDYVVFDQRNYVAVVMRFSLVLEATNMELMYDEAVLDIVYDNQDVLEIPLGEFYYAYQSNNQHLRVLELVATHAEYHDLTVSGLYIELGHVLSEDITLVDVMIGSSVAEANYVHTLPLSESVSYKEKLEDVLGVTMYRHLKREEGSLSFVVRKNQTIGLYVPLTYLREDLVLHRFYLKIGYIVGGVYKEEMIDDFPFIRENVHQFKEDEYLVCVPNTYSEAVQEDVQTSSSSFE